MLRGRAGSVAWASSSTRIWGRTGFDGVAVITKLRVGTSGHLNQPGQNTVANNNDYFAARAVA